MAHPDILADPTAHLHRLLTEALDATTKLLGWMQLHLHIRAGGSLPAQWRGEGTAAGEACGALRDAASFASAMMEGDLHDHFRKAERGLVEGS